MNQDDERRIRARRRAKQLRGFYQHLTVYLLVNIGLAIGLFTINRLTTLGSWWFYGPLIGTGFGWGIALLIHGLNVFGSGRFLGEEWEERKTRELLEQK